MGSTTGPATAATVTAAATAGAPTARGRGGTADAALAALGPASWGTTYVVTTLLLPPGRPLLVATLRALPAGLALLAATRQLPRGAWWWRTTVLAVLNFGAFFPLLFFAAYRLPGGVAATVGALQPLLVALLGVRLLGIRPTRWTLLAALVGMTGVALLVLRSSARLDPVGLAVMLAATALMALAVTLGKRWGRPPGISLLAFTGTQLTIGGLLLLPVLLVAEGLPGWLTGTNLLGFAYLGAVGTALAYVVWFRGIVRLPASSVSFLSLVNPVVATVAGLLLLHQTLTGWQVVGLVLALAGVILGQLQGRRPQAVPAAPEATALTGPPATDRNRPPAA